MKEDDRDNNYFDVVIVGGGPAGASLASLLSSNLRVLVLEKQSVNTTVAPNALPPHALRGQERIITLTHTSMCILERMQLWNQLRALTTKVQQVHISEADCFTKVRLNAQDVGVPALGYAIDSQHLSSSLQQHAMHSTAVTWQHIDQVETFQLTPHRVHLRYEHAQQSVSVQCGLLIAADGAHSFIRSHSGILAEHIPYQQTAILTHVEFSTSHGYCAYERFSPDATIAFLPFATHSGTMVVSVPNASAHTLRALSDQAFIQFIGKKLPFIADQLHACGPRFAHPLHSIKVHRAYRHGIILIGNAAHTLHPIAAQGFNLALRDIYVLAQLINQQNFNDPLINMTDLAQHYTALRSCDQYQIYALTDFIQNLFMSNDFHKKYLRNCAMQSINNIPLLKTWFTRRCMGLSG